MANPSPIIRAVVFDLDNTLMDFLEMKRQGCKIAARELVSSGVDLENKDAEKLLMQTHLDVGDEGEDVFEEFLKKLNKKVDKELVKKSFKTYNRAKKEFMKPYPNVIEVLTFLKGKGIKLAVITDAEEPQAMERILGIGVEKFFDAVITQSHTKSQKPDEKPFREALKKLGTKPEETLMVGDSLERDVWGAKRVGMLAAYAKYGEDWEWKWPHKEVTPDYVLHDICELMKIIG
ncbi:Glyceraldehyde 3-phosphate phosphatase [Candidatus Gugararchaeum adminiculabundum]|nr:Glyceraldehyde 3-phosphate phosphatase [Candidatus Gugararchaeum adminiculabundum]